MMAKTSFHENPEKGKVAHWLVHMNYPSQEKRRACMKRAFVGL